jgi:hypothetical protein
MDSLMKPFFKTFGQCEKPLLAKDAKKNYQDLLISLYKDMCAAHSTIFKEGCFKSQVITAKADFKEPDSKDSRYFPPHIQQYIAREAQCQLMFTCGNVSEREITVIFTLFEQADQKRITMYTQYVKMMYIWLHMCGKYAEKTCTETLHVFIYPTPFQKNLPDSPATIIGPEHINTAFTMACAKNGQILIFRAEEWFKVFIHETFHSYGLDFATHAHSDLKNAVKELFPINSDFSLYEAYTETWARILNCAFCSFTALPVKEGRKGQAEFLSNLHFCLEMERMFALYQCVKVLGFMGLQYSDLQTRTKRHLYKENTHVFAYYIMTAIFLHDQQGFLLWCKKHNTQLVRFNPMPAHFQAFAAYIAENSNCISLLKNFTQMESLNKQVNKGKNKVLMATTRMSIIE